MNIEPLEARITPAVIVVNATTATWLDVDGDLVTLKISKPVMSSITFASTDVGFLSTQVTRIDLGNPNCEGLSLTITAVPSVPGGSGPKLGDGLVNIGKIDAQARHLGSVTLRGDLGEIDAGDGTGTALQSLTIASLYTLGTTTGATTNFSNLTGSLGKFIVAGDLAGTIFIESGGNLGSATIGGSLLGGSADRTGRIFADGNLGTVVVKGSVIGGSAELTGTIGAGKNVGNVTIGGSLLGGSDNGSGAIYSGENGAGGTMGVIKIGGDVRGGYFTGLDDAIATGVITSAGGIASISIGGSLLQHRGQDSGRIVAAGDIGAVTIGGSIVGGDTGADLGGNLVAGGKITSVTVRGSVIGGASDASGTIEATTIGKLSIRGSLIGGAGVNSDELRASAGFGSIAIGGSILGGNDPDLSYANAAATGSGRIFAGSAGIVSLSVGDSIRSGNATITGEVGVAGKIGSITIGGDLAGASGGASGTIRSSAAIGQVTIGGSLLGGTGDFSGQLSGDDGIGKVAIGGSVVGGRLSSSSGFIFSATVSIRGDLRGGDGPLGGGTGPSDTGAIQGQWIGAVTIGGSIIAGGSFGAAPARSGSINADEDIGSIVVKGSLLGSAQVPVLITAVGQATPTATTDLAIKSISVGGAVKFAQIYGGFHKLTGVVNGNAQIGTVTVGGDWFASSLESGCTSNDGKLGDANDAVLAGFANDDGAGNNTIVARIASITIKGQVIGESGTNNPSGFLAEQIGSFKYNGITVPLTAGAKNDTFALGKARALGASLSTLNTDGFAVHVFEV